MLKAAWTNTTAVWSTVYKNNRLAPKPGTYIDSLYRGKISKRYTLKTFFIVLTIMAGLLAADKTGLMIASSNGYFDVVKTLLEKNAYALILDNAGKSVIDHARKNGHITTVALLDYYLSDDSQAVQRFEELVDRFDYDLQGDDSINAIAALLAKPRFDLLKKSVLDIPLLENELIWFFFDSRCKIGIDKSGSSIWMIDGIRVVHIW